MHDTVPLPKYTTMEMKTILHANKQCNQTTSTVPVFNGGLGDERDAFYRHDLQHPMDFVQCLQWCGAMYGGVCVTSSVQ
jgi:hypothetical protein